MALKTTQDTWDRASGASKSTQNADPDIDVLSYRCSAANEASSFRPTARNLSPPAGPENRRFWVQLQYRKCGFRTSGWRPRIGPEPAGLGDDASGRLASSRESIWSRPDSKTTQDMWDQCLKNHATPRKTRNFENRAKQAGSGLWQTKQINYVGSGRLALQKTTFILERWMGLPFCRGSHSAPRRALNCPAFTCSRATVSGLGCGKSCSLLPSMRMQLLNCVMTYYVFRDDYCNTCFHCCPPSASARNFALVC